MYYDENEEILKYIVTGKGYTSDLIKQADANANMLDENDFRDSNLIIKSGDKVYAPTESALESILAKSKSIAFTNAVTKLKDKELFRILMSSLYPDFFYTKTSLDELENLKIDRSKKFIIKPTRGFFGTAVKQLNQDTNLAEITQEIRDELAENTRYFSDSVLSTNELIIEQFVEGDEYAVDMYFNSQGKPEILNIYHHPHPEKVEYFHALYYTNKEIFDRFYDDLVVVFNELNGYLNITNFPIHAEFKLEDNKLVPIEMNPLRFGGFGLADLTYYAFGFNPFLAFFDNFKPDWQQIWQDRSDMHFGWVLGYNGTDVDVHTHNPNDAAFKKYLGDMLHYVEIDHKENPVFSIAYIRDKSSLSLQRLLNTEFNDFFYPIKKGA
jgi:ATP-grasp domain